VKSLFDMRRKIAASHCWTETCTL